MTTWGKNKSLPYGYMRVSATLMSQSNEDNTSTLVVTLGLYNTATSGPTTTSNGLGCSLVGNGPLNVDTTFNLSVAPGGSQSVISRTVTVQHNQDGTGSPSYTGHIDDPGTTVFGGGGSVTLSFDLPTIKRATTPSMSKTTFDAGETVTISLPRADSSFTHDLTYRFGDNVNRTDGFSDATAVGTSCTLTVPTSLLSLIPTSTQMTGTLTVVTKQGSTVVGTKTMTFTTKVPAAAAPSFSTMTCTEAVPAVASAVGAFVQKNSKLALAITDAAGIYGSTITSYAITVDGQTINAASGTTNTVQSAGTLTVSGTVTDSRGRTFTGTATITVLPYTPPSIDTANTSVTRADSGGTLDPDDGTYFVVHVKGGVHTLKPSTTEKNHLTYKVSTRQHTTGGAYTQKATATPAGISIDSSLSAFGTYVVSESFDVLVEITDLFATTQYLIVAPTGAALIDIRPDGVGVMKRWTQGALDVGGDLYVDGVLRLPSTQDESATSTAHPFQIGADNGANLRADNNQIDAYTNGAHSTLNLQTDTTGGPGSVALGTSDGTVTVPGSMANSGAFASTSFTATVGGVSTTFYLVRAGRLAHIYATSVTTASISATNNAVIATLPSGWASARQEFNYMTSVSSNTLWSVNTDGTLKWNQTATIATGSRIWFGTTYELAA